MKERRRKKVPQNHTTFNMIEGSNTKPGRHIQQRNTSSTAFGTEKREGEQTCKLKACLPIACDDHQCYPNHLA